MENNQDRYNAISCNFYDFLLAKATLKEEVQILYKDEHQKEISIREMIVDVYTKEGVEYLKLKNEQIIRLDYLLAVE